MVQGRCGRQDVLNAAWDGPGRIEAEKILSEDMDLKGSAALQLSLGENDSTFKIEICPVVKNFIIFN